MLLEEQGRVIGAVSPEVFSISTPSLSRFVKEIAGSDQKILKVLRNKKIQSFRELHQELVATKQRVKTMVMINRVLRAGMLCLVFGICMYGVGFYHSKNATPLDLFLDDEVLVQNADGTHINISKHFKRDLSIFNSRNIFAPVASIDSVSNDVASKSRKNFITSYLVVGIVLDHDSRAIVEDRHNNTTLFVGVDDALGTARVVAIDEHKIICDVNGQLVELKP